MVYAVSHFWGGQKKCVLGIKSGLMRCGRHPNFSFSFFSLVVSNFLCFSRITWAMGYSIFFSERNFYFEFCFFRVHSTASSFVASARVIRLLIFFFPVGFGT